MNTTHTAEHLAPTACTLGEGPVWHHGALWFVDIERGTLNRLRDDGFVESFDAGQRIGFATPTTRGDWIVGLQLGLARWVPGGSPPAVFHDPEPGEPNNRFNDGKADPTGRLYAGTINMPCDGPHAALYRIGTDLTVTSVRTGVTISNGLAWDARRHAMFYIDTPTQRITRYDWHADTGAIRNPTTAATFDPSLGSPDGMTIDAEGLLWVAMWGGSAVLRVDPETGDTLTRVEVDAPHVTSCCFGGDDIGTLYITTARAGLAENELGNAPRSGDIFSARPGARGLPTSLFAG